MYLGEPLNSDCGGAGLNIDSVFIVCSCCTTFNLSDVVVCRTEDDATTSGAAAAPAATATATAEPAAAATDAEPAAANDDATATADEGGWT